MNADDAGFGRTIKATCELPASTADCATAETSMTVSGYVSDSHGEKPVTTVPQCKVINRHRSVVAGRCEEREVRVTRLRERSGINQTQTNREPLGACSETANVELVDAPDTPRGRRRR